MANQITPRQEAMAAQLSAGKQAARRASDQKAKNPDAGGEAVAGGGGLGRAQRLAMQKAQAQLLGAKTQEEAELRRAQVERVMKTAKKVKKIIKVASAAAGSEVILPIIYLYLSYTKDYLLGNLLNGDPTGHFVKKKSFVGVAPLSFPEVLVYLAVTGSMFMNFIFMCWPLIVIGIIIFAVYALPISEWGFIYDIVKFLGLDIVNPILNVLGLPSISL
jgi:hypothetical protein